MRSTFVTPLILALSLLAPTANAANPANAAKVLAPSTEPSMPVISPDSPPSAAPMEGDNPNGTTLATAINLAAQQKMPESFGALHQLVLGGGSSFNVHGYHQQLHGQKADSWSLDLQPWAGVFVARHFLLGAILPIGYARGGNVWYANVGAGPLLAWHVPVGTHFALLPRISAAYQFGRARRTGSQFAEATSDSHAVYVNGRVDAVVHLTHHLSVVAGPYGSFSAYNRRGGRKAPYETYYGMQMGLLGWF